MEPLHELVVSHLDHYRGTSYSMHDQSRTWATRHELGTFLDLDHYRGTSYSMHDQSRTWATSLDNKRKPPEVLPKPAVWERRVVNLPITTVSRARPRIAPPLPPPPSHAVDTVDSDLDGSGHGGASIHSRPYRAADHPSFA